MSCILRLSQWVYNSLIILVGYVLIASAGVILLLLVMPAGIAIVLGVAGQDIIDERSR